MQYISNLIGKYRYLCSFMKTNLNDLSHCISTGLNPNDNIGKRLCKCYSKALKYIFTQIQFFNTLLFKDMISLIYKK